MNFEVHYIVPTAEGGKKEHVLTVGSSTEYMALYDRCKKFGYTILRNAMCDGCLRLGVDCNGSLNWVYTGCVNREVA